MSIKKREGESLLEANGSRVKGPRRESRTRAGSCRVLGVHGNGGGWEVGKALQVELMCRVFEAGAQLGSPTRAV
jgi:hypothetical protein